MEISKRGIGFIKSFEGLRLFAYKPIKSERFYTIGYGHCSPDIKANDTITLEQADTLLKKDISVFEKNVNKWQKQYRFNQNEFDALVSFAFNVGTVDRLLQYGKRSKKEIANSFKLYCYAGGKKNQGLLERRVKEEKLFSESINNETIYAQEYSKNVRGRYKILCKSLRIRDKPNGKQISSVGKNTNVLCYGYHTGKWLYIQYKGITGFIYGDKKYIEKVGEL